MIVGKVPSFWNGPFSGAMYGYVSFWERNCCWSVQPGCLGSLFQHPPGGWFRFKGDGVLLFFGEYFGGLVRFGYSTNPNEHQCTNIRGKYTTFAYSMFFYTSSIHIGFNMMVHRSQAVFRWKVRKRQVALGPRLFPNDRLRSWESASVSCGGSKKWRNPHTILFCLQIWCSTCVFGNMYACGHIYM